MSVGLLNFDYRRILSQEHLSSNAAFRESNRVFLNLPDRLRVDIKVDPTRSERRSILVHCSQHAIFD